MQYLVARIVSLRRLTHGEMPWLVSPPAAMTANGTWTVVWDLPTPPTSVKWVAVAISGCDNCVISVLDELWYAGPSAAGVLSTSTVVK
jgi:hypothetical protein